MFIWSSESTSSACADHKQGILQTVVCNNEGIHDKGDNPGYSYLWNENIAHRGAQEIS